MAAGRRMPVGLAIAREKNVNLTKKKSPKNPKNRHPRLLRHGRVSKPRRVKHAAARRAGEGFEFLDDFLLTGLNFSTAF